MLCRGHCGTGVDINERKVYAEGLMQTNEMNEKWMKQMK